MALSEEQIKEIRSQIIEQIKNTFPEDKKSEAISKIENMTSEEIVQFLEQNNLIVNENGNISNDSETQCVFCSIISGNIPSTKLAENSDAIAILEINPLSEGHTIIIPKNHSEEISENSRNLAEDIKEKIKNSLNPKQVILENSSLFGHSIINIIPIYGETIEKTRKKASVEELQNIREKILSAKEQPKNENKTEEKTPEKTEEEIKIIPKRIP